MRKPTLLTVTNGVIPSGYEKVARGLLEPLCDFFNIQHVAIGYRGAVRYEPWVIHPTSDNDRYGAQLYASLQSAITPDVTLFINDGWTLLQYPVYPKQWAYIAVDAPFIAPQIVERINKLEGAVFHTQFGRDTAIEAGVVVPCYVIPHGYDPHFKPLNTRTARKKLGIGEDLFIFGNVNVNQQRKRFDLSLYYFAEWVKKFNIPKSVRLFMQPLKHAAKGIPIYLYADYLGISDRLISTPIKQGQLITDDALHLIHNSFDVQFTTTSGESWGLTTMDGMACGIPQIVPDWSGLGEWSHGAAHLVECTNIQVTPLGTVGGIADKDAFIDALHWLYTDEAYRKKLKRASFDRARESQFEWGNIAQQFKQLFLTEAGMRD